MFFQFVFFFSPEYDLYKLITHTQIYLCIHILSNNNKTREI